MSVKRQADANDEWALDLIAGFLNTASEGATDRKWQAFARKANTKKRGTFQLDRMKLDDAISLRCQMHEALSFLRLEKWQFTEKKIPIPYAELISQLNDLKTPTEYYAREIKKSNKTWPGQRVLRTGVAGGLFRFGLALQPQRKDSYGFLAGALIRGTMNRLKVCRHCGKYIVVRDIKREFCPDTNCKNDFFNALKTAWAKQNKVDSLLPRAVRWVEELERDILAAGRVLTPEEIAIAQRVGVAQPERIRIRSVKTIAAPRDPELAEAAEKAGLCWATMSGLTAFYGIMLVEGDYTRELLAHECYHVRQYEEHGSIANFLEEYISQVLVWGYGDARLERDAREVARGYELTLR